MPHRRRILLVAPLFLAGCAIELPAGSVSVAAPISIEPTPSASAGVPKHVCTTVYQILTDGAVRVGGSADDDKVRQVFADMATRVDAERAATTDAALNQALSDISTELKSASRQTDPGTYVHGGFETVGRKLDGKC